MKLLNHCYYLNTKAKHFAFHKLTSFLLSLTDVLQSWHVLYCVVLFCISVVQFQFKKMCGENEK